MSGTVYHVSEYAMTGAAERGLLDHDTMMEQLMCIKRREFNLTYSQNRILNKAAGSFIKALKTLTVHLNTTEFQKLILLRLYY
jgi:hypothetical protein